MLGEGCSNPWNGLFVISGGSGLCGVVDSGPTAVFSGGAQTCGFEAACPATVASGSSLTVELVVAAWAGLLNSGNLLPYGAGPPCCWLGGRLLFIALLFCETRVRLMCSLQSSTPRSL